MYSWRITGDLYVLAYMVAYCEALSYLTYIVYQNIDFFITELRLVLFSLKLKQTLGGSELLW